jgi:biotin carboxyl carrier protein
VTNKSFVLDLLDQPEVIDASADTGWIDRVRGEGRLVSHRHSTVALAAAAIEAYEEQERTERQRLLSTAFGGRPQVRHESGRPLDLKLRGARYRVRVARVGAHRFRVGVEAGGVIRTADVELDRFDPHTGQIAVNGTRYRLLTHTHGPIHLVEVDGVTHRVSRDEGGVLRAPAPALVVATPVAVGTEVDAGAPVLVLESMKMETVLYAPFKATVRELPVSTGSQVETGAPLIRLEPVGDAVEGPAGTGNGVDLDLPVPAVPPTAAERAARGLDDLSSMLLGFDIDPRDEGRTLTGYLTARAELAEPPVAEEIRLLRLFADFAELSRNRPAGEELNTELRVHSPKEHFHTYLQTLDIERAGLPAEFCDRLARVLEYYGVTDLDRSEQLTDAVFRIFLAQQRISPDVLLVTSLLQRWLAEPMPRPPLDSEVYAVLDHLVLATQLRFPVIGDLARSVRFRWFDQPLVDEARAEVLAGVGDELAALALDPEAPEYAQRVEALATIPEQIVRFLADRLEQAVNGTEPMLEVLVRRHYLEFELHDLRNATVGGRAFTTADYTLDARPTHLVSTIGTVTELADLGSGLVRDLAAQIDDRPAGHEAVADLYLSWRCRAPVRRPRTPCRHRRRTGRWPRGVVLHVPSVGRGRGRGRERSRRTPDGRAAAQPVAAARLQDHQAGRARGRAALPLCCP